MHALALAFQPTAAAAPAPVRVQTDDDGTVWFCGSDVATALGYARPGEAVAKLSRPEGTLKRRTLTPGGEQELLFITEPNVYRLIVRSRRPEAEAFERWVFEDVLPMIRRTGRYAAAEGERLDPANIRLKRAENAIATLTQRLSDVETEHRTLMARLLGVGTAADASRELRRSNGTGRTGYYGVVRHRDQFRARITAKGRQISLGTYATAEAAARAYDAAVLVHGQSHKRPLNFPETLHPTA